MPAWLWPVELRVEQHDGLRMLVWPALGGLALGAAMAVLGLPPIDIHGLAHYAGIMGPFCGGTRSVWAAMNGDLALSWTYNPLGVILVLGAVGTLARFLVGAASGRWVNARVRSWAALGVVAGALTVLLGVRQQMHAELLSTPAAEFSPVGPILNALPVLVLMTWVVIARRRLRTHARPHGAG